MFYWFDQSNTKKLKLPLSVSSPFKQTSTSLCFAPCQWMLPSHTFSQPYSPLSLNVSNSSSSKNFQDSRFLNLISHTFLLDAYESKNKIPSEGRSGKSSQTIWHNTIITKPFDSRFYFHTVTYQSTYVYGQSGVSVWRCVGATDTKHGFLSDL